MGFGSIIKDTGKTVEHGAGSVVHEADKARKEALEPLGPLNPDKVVGETVGVVSGAGEAVSSAASSIGKGVGDIANAAEEGAKAMFDLAKNSMDQFGKILPYLMIGGAIVVGAVVYEDLTE